MERHLYYIHLCLYNRTLNFQLDLVVFGLLGLGLDLFGVLLIVKSIGLEDRNQLGVKLLGKETQIKDISWLHVGCQVAFLFLFDDIKKSCFLHLIKELQSYPAVPLKGFSIFLILVRSFLILVRRNITKPSLTSSFYLFILTMLHFQNNLQDCMQAQQLQRREQDKQRRYIKVQSKAFKSQKFEFKTYELAFTVRQILYEKIIQFDANGDMQFQQSQIREFLISILHQMETEIHYFIKNVFRYDVNNDGVIEYDELVNFCMEQHLGEIAIQRLHRQKIYSKGSQRMMSQEEFTKTINYALSFLQFKPAPVHLQVLFRAVDIDNDGDISYQDYFRFLKEYFGSKSFAAKLVNTSTVLEEIKHSKQHPSEKKDLDIVRKYSKYENNANQDGGSIPKKNLINPNNNINPSNNTNPNNNANGSGSGNTNSNPASKSTIISSNKNNDLTNNNKHIGQGQAQNQSGNNSQNSNQNSNQNAQSLTNSKTDNNNNNFINPNNNLNPSNIIQPKGRPSIPPGIAMTISNKQPNKAKEITLSQPESVICSRIARLVLTQLKVTMINLDITKTMTLTAEDLTKYLRSRLSCNENSIQSIIKKGGLQKDKKYSYEEASKFVIIQFITKVFTQANFTDLNKPITLQDFVALLERICSIVPNTPLLQKYEQLFKMRVGRLGNFDYNDTQALATHIFNSYSFRH